MQTSILNLSQKELIDFLQSIEEKSYRAKQIYEGIYAQNKITFDDFTTLSHNTRDILKKKFTLRELKKVDEVVSNYDKTQKFLWQLSDGYKIESVVIYENKRTTFCISSQVGCALDCKFCATGKMGILRNLKPGEIIEQVLNMQDEISQRPSNIVFMGMGEPMLNYDAVIQSAQIMSDPLGLNMGRRRITVSTSGVLPGIERFIQEKQPYSLAISLNSTDEEIRKKIMPISKKYPIEALMHAAKLYTEKMNRLITFEYVLIDNINSSIKHAKELIRLTHQIPCKINVIPCNSIDPDYLPPAKHIVKEFENYVN